MSIYSRVCNVSARVPPFSYLGNRSKNRELEKAVNFLAPLMMLSVQGVMAAAYLMSTAIFVLLLLIAFFLEISLFLSIPLAIISAILMHYAIGTYPISKMNSFRLSLSEEADIVFEQFVLVFQSGGTIFNAIEMVAQSHHPFLSKAFKEIIARIETGVPPETCLMEFANGQPSDDLRRYIIAILSSLERKTDLLEALSGESFEADMTLRQRNMELESRLLIVAALVTYVPILLTLTISLGGMATNPLIILFAPVFIMLNMLMKSRFTSQFSTYFDRPREGGIIAPSQKEIIAEYDEFLNFLMLLSERLRLGDTLEVALPAIRNEVGPEVQRLVDPAINSVYWQGNSIKEAIALSVNEALGQRVAGMLDLIVLMCEASARDAGERLARITARLVKRSAVAKERDSIIAAQRLKIHILSLTSAFVLGLLASLSPFLFIGSLLSQDSLGAPMVLSLFDVLPLIFTLLLTTISMGYQNTIMVSDSRGKMMGLICGLIFWMSFSLSASMLHLELV